eukprot:tig00000367_g24458.t1
MDDDLLALPQPSSSSSSSSSEDESPAEAPRIPGDPFDALGIWPRDPLFRAGKRVQCDTCGAQRKYYCYTCCKVLLAPEDAPRAAELIPSVQLPIHLDVVQHWQELRGKSTAVHAQVLCPGRVSLYTFPEEVPQYDDPSRVLLLFPSPEAVSMEEMSLEELRSYERVLVVDCTWNQAHAIVTDPRLAALRRVRIADQRTLFWRHQRVGEHGLATIEAIYHFYRERAERLGEGPAPAPGAPLANLLFLFAFQWAFIQHRYRSNPRLRFTPKHARAGDYIVKDPGPPGGPG